MRGAGSGGGAAGPGCGNCGSQDLETIRPGWIEGLGTWLRSRGRWPSSQVCRRCGHVTPAGSVAYLAPRKRRWPVPALGARREQRWRRDMAERFRTASFPLYGLPASWTGPRHLGGMASHQARGQPPVVTSLTLAHGDPAAGHGPELEGRVVVLQARDLVPEQVELVRVTDVEPYVAGTERLEQARAGRGRTGG